METAIGAMGPLGVAAAAAAAGAALLKVRALPAIVGALESATAESALVVLDLRRALTEADLAVACVFADGFEPAFVACAEDAWPDDAPDSLSSA